MSGQYLEAHAFLKTLRDKGVPYTETLVNLMQYAVIEDVVPVIHAHWEITKLTSKWIFVCSHCRYGWYESYEGEDIAWKYCPDCGAKMDEEEGQR